MLQQWTRLCAALAFTSLLGLLPGPVSARALPQGVTQVASVEGITEYRLDNGLKILLFPDASKPTALVNVTYLVGSRQENYGETGMAHLLEHLMFKGSPRHPNIPQDFNTRGMRFNGTTALDRTNYYELFQAGDDNLKWALEMEADRMVNSSIAKKDLDSEMTVVRNEFERGENLPFGVLLKRLQNVAYDWHSYGKATIGNRSDIENVKIDNLQAFYRTYYQPDNAVLLVAGKFDPATTLKWISDSFGKLPKPKRKLPEFWTVEPTQDGERSVTVRRKGDFQIIAVAYHMPSGLHDDSDTLGVAAAILADTPNGRLHKQLVETGKAVQVFQTNRSGFAPGLQVLGAVVKKDQPLEPVRDALLAAIENFHQTPPSADELQRVQRDVANDIEKMLNDPERVGVGLSESIALGDWRLLLAGRDRMQKVTSQEVAASAQRYFRRDNRTVGYFIPEDQPQRAEIPATPTLAEALKDFKPKTQAAVIEAFDPSQENIDARTQRSKVGGVELALLPKKTRGETVSVSLSLHWGDEQSLYGKKMVSNMAAAMLTRGNSKYTREQLADEFSKRKISGNLYRFDTTRANLVEALRLVAQVVKEPTFPANEFEQLRNQMLVNAEAQRNEPGARASEAIAQHFNRYPKEDWRAPLTLDETIAAIKAVTLEDVKAFHKNFYGATKAELAIVGDFDPAEVKTVVADVFGNWKGAPYAHVTRSYFDIPAMRESIDTPDKENGVYTAAVNVDMRDDDPEFPALYVANYIFGGSGMDSRLMQRVRQKDGLTYGVGSGLHVDSIDRAGRFLINATAAPQNLARVDAAISEELKRVLKEGFTPEELARAKSSILQQRAQARAQDAGVAQGWNTFLFLGRTYAWSKDFENHVSALTLDQVNAAFRKAIDPAKLSVVLAGDNAKIKLATGQPVSKPAP